MQDMVAAAHCFPPALVLHQIGNGKGHVGGVRSPLRSGGAHGRRLCRAAHRRAHGITLLQQSDDAPAADETVAARYQHHLHDRFPIFVYICILVIQSEVYKCIFMKKTARTRPRDAAATRAAILKSARAAFARSGYEGTGEREIAAGAGVTAILGNRYFGSKEGLFAEVVDATMDDPS